MAPHSSPLAWKIPRTEEPGRLRSMGLQRVGHDWATSLSLFTFTHWRRKWQPTPVFLPGESQGQGSLVGSMGSHRVGHDCSDSAAAAGHRSRLNVHQQMDEYIHTVEYYWAFKDKEICHMLQHKWTLSHHVKWNKPVTKRQICIIRLTWGIYSNQLIEAKYCGRYWDWRKEEIREELIIPFAQNISYTRWKCSRHPCYNNMHTVTRLYCTLTKCWKWKWSRSVTSDSLWPRGL